MKSNISKTEAQEKISSFFKKDSFTSSDIRKIKSLAMKYKIKLGNYRKMFCKSCLNQLKGRIKVTKTHKTIICSSCKYKNKFKLSL